jgi:GNAT superfamily N-acetyltransferase
MTEHDIRLLGPGDLDEAVAVMVAAFAQDPLVAALFPAPADRQRAMPILFRSILAPEVRLRRTWGAGSPLEGVAVWHLPGARGFSWRGLADSTTGQLRLLPWAVRLARGWEVQACVERLQKAGGARERAHLYFLGVRPGAQGRGVASSLVRPVLERHPRAWTETQNPRNVPLYEHLGFRVFGTEEAARLGVRVWALQRD